METIILSEEMEPESEEDIPFYFLDPKNHNLLGNETIAERGRDGKITFNPYGCQIFSLPPLRSGNTILGDRYLIHIRFTLHEAPERACYEWIKFQATMEDSRVITSDLFPDQVVSEYKEQHYSFSSHDLIVAVPETQEVCRRFRFRSLMPKITAYGEGDSFFRWVHSTPPEEGGVKSGNKHGLVILQVPYSTQAVTAEVSMEAALARLSLRKWRRGKKDTHARTITWDLTQALPFCPDPDTQKRSRDPDTTRLIGPGTKPIKILFSYAHNDEKFRDKLENHLSDLKHNERIVCWHDRRIRAGDSWNQEISSHLDTADIILLLVSDDFLASKYCYTFEMMRALARHTKGEACVIPIMLHPVDWTNETIAQFRALPSDARPVVEWPDPDAAFYNITQGIKEVIIEMEKSR